MGGGVWSRMRVLKPYAFCKGQNSQKPTLVVGFSKSHGIVLQQAGCDTSPPIRRRIHTTLYYTPHYTPPHYTYTYSWNYNYTYTYTTTAIATATTTATVTTLYYTRLQLHYTTSTTSIEQHQKPPWMDLVVGFVWENPRKSKTSRRESSGESR